MSEDRLEDQISKGKRAASIEPALLNAAERVKDSLGKHLLKCKPEEMVRTRDLYNVVDQVVAALQAVMNDGKVAERELESIERRTHKIYEVA